MTIGEVLIPSINVKMFLLDYTSLCHSRFYNVIGFLNMFLIYDVYS